MFRELKRKNKQVPNEECIRLLRSEMRGILSVLGDDDYPYGSPMNFWYNEEDGNLYFHSGMKEDYPINVDGSQVDFGKLYAYAIGEGQVTFYFTSAPSTAFNVLIREAV